MKHGILNDFNGYYHITTLDETLTDYEPSIAHMMMLMNRCDIDVLWAMPDCRFSKTVRREQFEAMESQHYSVYVPEHTYKNRVEGARVRYLFKGAYNLPEKSRYFMFPGNREWKVPQNGDKGVWNVN